MKCWCHVQVFRIRSFQVILLASIVGTVAFVGGMGYRIMYFQVCLDCKLEICAFAWFYGTRLGTATRPPPSNVFSRGLAVPQSGACKAGP